MSRGEFKLRLRWVDVIGGKSAKTCEAYQLGLNHFLRVNNFSDEEDALRAIKKRGADEYLVRFISSMREKSPKTVHLYASAVRLWLQIHGVQFNNFLLRKLLPPKRVIKECRPITRAQLVMILRVLRPSKKLPIWLSWACGLRLNELTHLRVGDVDLNSEPPRITVRGTKTKSANRIVFVPKDLANELIRVIEGRDPSQPLFINERGGAMNDFRLQRSFFGALKRLGLQARDPSNRGWLYSFHSLRRGFETTLHNAGMPMGVLALLLGHDLGTEASYYKPSLNELANIWRQYEKYLIVEGVDVTGVETVEIRKKFESEVSSLRAELEYFKTIVTALIGGNVYRDKPLSFLLTKLRKYSRTLTPQDLPDFMQVLLALSMRHEELRPQEIDTLNSLLADTVATFNHFAEKHNIQDPRVGGLLQKLLMQYRKT
ncbi:MAG: tyrosine-type recombinase/integrase [Nitrososphaerota archaeon]